LSFFAKFVYKRIEKVQKPLQMKPIALKLKEITDLRNFTQLHSAHFSEKKANFTKNDTAVKL